MSTLIKGSKETPSHILATNDLLGSYPYQPDGAQTHKPSLLNLRHCDVTASVGIR